ncbi:MAG TPA: right-handed parallel beta-helix repeat-containing protein [Thermoanaerobaculia bacterium]|jgi:hypothetical protein|nr:right-handed parallel beta-helix repeat-containing protein [Thermoanaerobaculia bacterium]
MRTYAKYVATTNVSLGSPLYPAIDGFVVHSGDRVLCVGQTNHAQNGLYVVGHPWHRAPDASTEAQLAGISVFVTNGVAYASSVWQLTTNLPIAVDGKALTFVRIPGNAFVFIDDFAGLVDKAGHWDHALAAALALAGTTGAGTVAFGPKRYGFAQTIHLLSTVHLLGSGTGVGSESSADPNATVLLFPDGVPGIVVDIDATQSTDPVTKQPVITVHSDATNCIIEKMRLQSIRTNPDQPSATAHAIDMRRTATVRDVVIREWSGDGIHIEPQGVGANSNNWRVEDCLIVMCTGDGLFVKGKDANAGLASGCSITDCSGDQVHEESDLGNTYVSVHMNGGQVSSSAVVALGTGASVFVGCYVEDGMVNRIDGPSLVLGGQMAAHTTAATGGVLQGGGGGIPVFPRGLKALNLQHYENVIDTHGGNTYPYVQLGFWDPGYNASKETAATTPPVAMSFGYWGHGGPAQGYAAGGAEELTFSRGDSGWVMTTNGAGTSFHLMVSGYSYPGYAGDQRIGIMWFQRGLMVGGGNVPFGEVFMTSDIYPPSYYEGNPSKFAQGDVVWNRHPDPSAAAPKYKKYAGWICVEDGTPGKWRGFGLIGEDELFTPA